MSDRCMRILQATVANDRGGLTGYILSNYRNIDRTRFQFDFLTYDDVLDFRAEVEAMGARFFQLPRASHFFAYLAELRALQRENHYDAIHLHLSYANPLVLLAAKLAGFPRILVHSHSTWLDDRRPLARMAKSLLHRIGRRMIPQVATDMLACSGWAAEWMYPPAILRAGRAITLHNAIHLERFSYREEVRNQLRNELGISKNQFCVGHVGRFTYQKNHEFLIRIFAAVHARQQNAVLLLVGDGPERPAVEQQVHVAGLDGCVRFLGQRDDIASLYSAMDVIALPSRFEGLCIVAIEAQMSGLPCICSDALPLEAGVLETFQQLPLMAPVEAWADAVCAVRGIERRSRTAELRQAGYDDAEEIHRMEEIYGGGER